MTNLNNSGPGSFRTAMLTPGKRIVIFRVSGTIELDSLILVSTPHSDVYVAGQTAPGDGIQILGSGADTAGHVIRFRGNAAGSFDNAILRYLSWRGQKGDAARADVMAVQTSTNFILDHNSMAFSSDEILGFSALSCERPDLGGGRPMQNISVTNNLVAEPFEPHTTAAIFSVSPLTNSPTVLTQGKGVDEVPNCDPISPYAISPPAQSPFDVSVPHQGARSALPDQTSFSKLTIHRNVFTAATHRTPTIGTVDTSHTNNISYGAEIASTQTYHSAEVDSVGNMVLAHQGVWNSPIHNNFLQQRVAFIRGRTAERYNINDPNAFFSLPPSIFISGLYYESAPNIGSIIDPWTATNNVPDFWKERTSVSSRVTIPPHIIASNWPCDGSDWRCVLNAKRDAPLHNIDGSGSSPYACAVQVTPDQTLMDSILDDAGNSKGVTCDGNWVARRQPTDTRQINDVRNRTDSIGGARAIGRQGGKDYPQLASISPRTIDEVGGYDLLESSTPCLDTDSDGMPDAFETRYGFDINVDDALLDSDNDGYTNLEEWFNATIPVIQK